MSDQSVFTVRIDPDKKQELEKIAAHRDRSRNYLVGEAIDHYLDLYRWQTEQIESGLREAEAGHFASDADVNRVFSKYKKSK